MGRGAICLDIPAVADHDLTARARGVVVAAGFHPVAAPRDREEPDPLIPARGDGHDGTGILDDPAATAAVRGAAVSGIHRLIALAQQEDAGQPLVRRDLPRIARSIGESDFAPGPASTRDTVIVPAGAAIPAAAAKGRYVDRCLYAR